jgi:hypothetical protein
VRTANDFAFRHVTDTMLAASAQAAFEYLDDFRKLSAHMEQPSAMMLGSRMEISTDVGGGRAVGSHVRMRGRMLGVQLSLEEVVVERDPPRRKAWDTVEARLIVIGQYRLGFELEPRGALARLPAALCAKIYARWCTVRMAADARRHFESTKTTVHSTVQ